MNPVTADSFDSLRRQLEIWYALFMNLYPRIIMRVICGAQRLLRQDQSHTPLSFVARMESKGSQFGLSCNLN